MDWREFRRRSAWELKEQGWKQKDIAIDLGVSKGAVIQWMSRAEQQGVEALRRHPAPGAKPNLTVEQQRHIPDLLAQGAEAFGSRGQVWTSQRVAEVIQRTFGLK